MPEHDTRHQACALSETDFIFHSLVRDKDVRNRQSLSSFMALRVVLKCNASRCVAEKNKKTWK